MTYQTKKKKRKSCEPVVPEKRHTLLYTMRFGRRLQRSDERSLSSEKLIPSDSDDDETSEKLLMNIYLWDQDLPIFPFPKNINSKNPTIFKFLHVLSNPDKWEGITQQRHYIHKILTAMFGFSLKFGCDYLLLLIDYMCDCELDPRHSQKEQTPFSVVEAVHSDVIDTWNSSVLKSLAPKGKTLLSYYPEVTSFLNWLALEVSFQEGVLNHHPSFQVSSVITELMVTINNALDTYGNAGTIRRFLLRISQQPRCFQLEMATKTQIRMLFIFVASGRELKTLWSSVDKNGYFNCEQPNFGLLIDDLVDHVMSQSISEDSAKQLLRTTVNEMYEVVENGLDGVSISDLLNLFLQVKVKMRSTSSQRSTPRISAWLHFLKAAGGHWILLTEKWREFTDGATQLSLTVDPDALTFLRKYFLLFAATGFLDAQHKVFGDGVQQIVACCRVKKFVDNHRFNDVIKNILNSDWTKIECIADLFHGIDQLGSLNTIDSLIPDFQATRLG